MVRNADGNAFIKQEDERCASWRNDFGEIVSLSINLQSQSINASFKCLNNGPDNSDAKIEVVKNSMFEKFENIVTHKNFKTYKVDRCFGGPADNFINAIFANSLNSFYNAKMLCSSEVKKIFQKSDNPDEYIKKFRELIKSDYERLQKIDQIYSKYSD